MRSRADDQARHGGVQLDEEDRGVLVVDVLSQAVVVAQYLAALRAGEAGISRVVDALHSLAQRHDARGAPERAARAVEAARERQRAVHALLVLAQVLRIVCGVAAAIGVANKGRL